MRTQRHRDVSYEKLSDAHDCTIKQAIEHAKGHCDCDTEAEAVDDDKPWREEEVVKTLFVEENMYFTEMAEMIGCHPETARNWVLKHDVSPVPSTHRTSSKTVRKLQRLGEETDIGDIGSLKDD